jgi:ABC-type uncharacterized transport system substrate-binding protein
MRARQLPPLMRDPSQHRAGVAALQQQTRNIPIVVVQITDPVGSGFVESLARPGGNITGFTVAEFSMFGKLLEVIKEVAPHVTRVGVVLNPDQAPQLGMWRAIEGAAPAFKVQLTVRAFLSACIGQNAHCVNCFTQMFPL